ncbi:DUF1116 domain-containing protein [Avibacterium sp. 20-15]|uniref:DUF1116 domain-containing protein n=1 Tax=unclassified Avibacterium TaxID=2685287 RepID=UPI0020272EE1|nr:MULTISPECIES: DUF1116 domain-containing protein [unclassified Avibacterium]MCW9732952.1 DUF1116 domain-containing protein [Avibacterium sp. 20-15]URL05086.1 DUF1116 domain-containing protein [Avibacterium sp. 20-132]
MNNLFQQPLSVANIGLESFAKNIQQAGATVQHLHWQPPAQGNKEIGLRLAELSHCPKIEQANQIALSRYLTSQPALVDVVPAYKAIPQLMNQKRILHAGPPIQWQEMCGPMQGAIIGAILFEGWAKTTESAQLLIEQGEVFFEPCHHYNAVGPMAGIISPSMPVWVVEDMGDKHHRCFSNFNEGLGKALRFGANNPEVIKRLHWMRTELADSLSATLKLSGPIELKPIMAQALHMGDEIHNRNAAATSLFLKKLLPFLLKVKQPLEQLERVIQFITNNDHFFLNLSMAACKTMLSAAEGVPHSTMVTVMARNGVNFGIQISSLKQQWFQAPANAVKGLFFPNFGINDAAADLGDSAITETAGVGGFAMASAPAIVKFVGGTTDDALNHSVMMQNISIGKNPAFTLPTLNFTSTAVGIDIRKVIDTGILPIINTGIAHKLPGIGQIGAGITTAPMQCFTQALQAFYKTYANCK